MYYKELPFKTEKQDGFRYCYQNNYYSYLDAITLFCMMRKYKPKQIIEVGSGWSSALMLDTNEKFFDNKMTLNFIEPYTDRLLSLIREKEKCNIIQDRLQNVKMDFFQKLEKNDILFIDSTHVSKIDSDVNYILFEIMPSLKQGVLVHFHDIHYPFEYPKEAIYEGFAWNEIYMIRAFLQYNNEFKIKYWNNYLAKNYSNEIFSKLPLCENNIGGSLWIEKK